MNTRHTGGGAVKIVCSNPPPFQWQHFRRLYLLHSSGRQRYLCQASSLSSPSCDLTFVLTPEVDLCMPLTPRSLKSVHSFSKYRIHNLLTENTRTNGTTNKQVQNIMLPASLDWCRHKRRIRSLKVLCSCVFIMQNALSAIATFPVHLLGEGGGEEDAVEVNFMPATATGRKQGCHKGFLPMKNYPGEFYASGRRR